MSTTPKQVVQRFFDEAINQRRLEILDEILAPNFRGNILEKEQSSNTRAELKQMLALVLTAFPDYQQTIHDWIVEGEKVVARWTTQGTHQGDYNGITPTNKVIYEHGIDIFRVVNGQIVEHWVELDILGIFQQMGVVTIHKSRG
jgi:steroid delta-isomerase-like uncharacterized protein